MKDVEAKLADAMLAADLSQYVSFCHACASECEDPQINELIIDEEL